MNTSVDIEIPGFGEQKNFISSLRLRRKFLVLVFGIVGFVLPMIYGFVNDFPVPHVQDEFGYVVGADTFANGRLTNPTPAFYEHFESPHLLFAPSYASKYPPMQSLFMVAGQVLFGQPIFGIWLSCGAAAAALFWMLLAWTKPKWAVLGTILMILLIGITSYWAQSYWGGMVAFTGGSLFFGGVRRNFDKLSVGATLLMILGGIILVNSRPFEGFVTMVPALVVLFIYLLKDKENSLSLKLRRVVLPAFCLTAVALSGMLYYNFKITGSALTLPYSIHQSQYHPAALFVFQSPNPEAAKGHPRLRKLYAEISNPPILKDLYSFGFSETIYLRPFYGFVFLFLFVPYFLLSPPLIVFLYFAAVPLAYKDRRLLLIVSSIVFTFACMSLAAFWDLYHYAAPITCCFYVLLVEGFRRLTDLINREGKKSQKNLAYVLIVVLIGSSIAYPQLVEPTFAKGGYSSQIGSSLETLKLDKATTLEIPKRATYFKAAMEKAVETLPGKYIAVVSYASNYSVHDEIVYNKADIENAKLVWAYDLGEEKNAALLDYYNDRKILRVKISGSQIEIIPQPSN